MQSDGWHKINPAARNNWAIGSALANGHVEIVKLLLAKEEERPDLHENIALEQR
jgi:hypothetical protein